MDVETLRSELRRRELAVWDGQSVSAGRRPVVDGVAPPVRRGSTGRVDLDAVLDASDAELDELFRSGVMSAALRRSKTSQASKTLRTGAFGWVIRPGTESKR